MNVYVLICNEGVDCIEDIFYSKADAIRAAKGRAFEMASRRPDMDVMESNGKVFITTGGKRSYLHYEVHTYALQGSLLGALAECAE